MRIADEYWGGGSAVQLLNFPTKYLYSRPKIKVRWTGVDISLNNKGSELTPSWKGPESMG